MRAKVLIRSLGVFPLLRGKPRQCITQQTTHHPGTRLHINLTVLKIPTCIQGAAKLSTSSAYPRHHHVQVRLIALEWPLGSEASLSLSYLMRGGIDPIMNVPLKLLQSLKLIFGVLIKALLFLLFFFLQTPSTEEQPLHQLQLSTKILPVHCQGEPHPSVNQQAAVKLPF